MHEELMRFQERRIRATFDKELEYALYEEDLSTNLIDVKTSQKDLKERLDQLKKERDEYQKRLQRLTSLLSDTST